MVRPQPPPERLEAILTIMFQLRPEGVNLNEEGRGGGAGEIRVPLSSDVTADQKFLARQVAEQGNF